MQLGGQPALDRSCSTASAPTCCAPPAPSTATRWWSTRVDRGQERPGVAVGLRATKGAVVGFTQAMHKELGAEGIKSTALCPGVRRHADDRLRQGSGPGRGDDHDLRTSPRRCRAAAEALARVRHPRDPVHPARGPSRLGELDVARRARARVGVGGGGCQPAPTRCASRSRRRRSPGGRRSPPPRSRARRRSTPPGCARGRAARGPWRGARACARGEAVPGAGEGQKLVRPPRRWAASIGQTPPARSG